MIFNFVIFYNFVIFILGGGRRHEALAFKYSVAWLSERFSNIFYHEPSDEHKYAPQAHKLARRNARSRVEDEQASASCVRGCAVEHFTWD